MANILRSKLLYNKPETENLIALIRNGLRSNRDRTILIDADSGSQWTGKQIEPIVANYASYLVDQCSLKKGDVCSLYCPGDDKAAISILSIICAGGICSFFNSNENSGRQLHDTADSLGSKFLISNRRLLENIHKDIESLDHKLDIISMDKPYDKFKRESKSIDYILTKDYKSDSLLDDLCERIKIEPDTDLGVIHFSSGTTGKPKPIPRTHKNLCHLVASVDHEELMDLKPGVVMGGTMVMTHRPGLWALLASVKCGNTFVIKDCKTVPDALETIQKYGITIYSMTVPFLMSVGSQIAALKQKYDTSSLKHIITAGNKIVTDTVPKLVVEELKLKSLRQCFGMTESGWVFFIEQSKAAGRYLSVGHVVPGTEAKIIDRESGKTLAAHQRGEIALRGPQLFPGYLTAQAGQLNRSDFTDDGWFKIGDQGYFDDEEFVYIEGRYKEFMILRNDDRYFPNELEAIIGEHPAIANVCVVKKPPKAEQTYDVAQAFVILYEGQTIQEEEVIKFAQKASPGILLDGGIKVLDKYPRLSNGKIDRQSLSKL